MTIKFSVVDATTGEILRTGSCMTDAQADAQAGPGEVVIKQELDPQTQVVTNPSSGFPGVQTRPVIGSMVANKTTFIANGVDAVTIPNIPPGAICKLSVPSNKGINPYADFTINDGSLVITTTVAGSYGITISSYPNADYKVTLNAS